MDVLVGVEVGVSVIESVEDIVEKNSVLTTAGELVAVKVGDSVRVGVTVKGGVDVFVEEGGKVVNNVKVEVIVTIGVGVFVEGKRVKVFVGTAVKVLVKGTGV